MVTQLINPYCRLANVMWQIGHVISYARKYNLDYIFPENRYMDYFPSLKIGQYDCQIYGEKIIDNTYIYEEIQFMENVKFQGYWQSHKYIEFAIEELRDLFLIDNMTLSNICSLHVRRGDYGSNGFPFISMDYIELAVKYIFEKTGIKNFIIYSDDLDWCRQNVVSKLTEYNFDFSKGIDIEDLRQMARCEHNIICNSSFSLIAAELNRNTNKIVVSPDYTQWFDNGTIFHQINPMFHQIKI